MDALILSCGTGGGHNSACMALAQALSARGHNVRTLNPYLLASPKTADFVNNAYNIVAQRVPSAFGVAYRLGNACRRLPGSSPVYHVNSRMAPLFEKFLRENHFDAIAATHLFPAEIITNLRRHGVRTPTMYFVATDYTCVPFTEETDCDYYITPSAALTDEYIARGVPEARIVPLGIPVGQSFHEPLEKEAARALLGLEKSAKYILIAGGCIGAGQIEQVVPLLLRHYDESVRIIVICGNNHALYRRLKQRCLSRCTLLEYTTQMAAYIRACDLFLSKPGGLSSTEAAVVGTPLIHITPIPGCETRNMTFFEENGMSYAVKSPRSQLLSACDRLLDPQRQREMLENQKRVIPANASAAISAFMEQNHEIASKKVTS